MQEVGNEEPTTRARGREATFEQSRDVMVDVVPGDDAWTWLASTVEDFDLLLGEKSSGEGLRYQPFFLDRP